MVVTDKLNALEISLTIGCRLDCKFCPQSLLLSKYFENDKKRNAKLKLEDFKVALKQVRPGGGISFCGMSEPFHNEECADMILYASEQGYKISLLTTLVGMRMEDFEKIKNIPFDSFVLHIPDKDRNSKFEITESYLELLKRVNKEIKIDYYSCHGTPHEKVVPFLDKDKYAGIALGNRAGNLFVEGYQIPKVNKGSIICYHGSEKQIGGWMPVMLPDGTLVLCCQDYGMKHQLGNLIKNSWKDIQHGDEFQFIQKGLENDKLDILCRRCGDSRKVESLPAMQIGAILSEARIDNKILEKYGRHSVISRLAEAKTVAVFGLGKLFWDHFFQEHWNEGLNVSVFLDNNEEVQGTKIHGIECASPMKVINYEDLLVVIYVKSTGEIERQLNNMGISNYVTIDEIMNEYCDKIEKMAKRLSL